MATDQKQQTAVVPSSSKNYKGFVAGVFSGIAKLSGEFYLPFISLLSFFSFSFVVLDWAYVSDCFFLRPDLELRHLNRIIGSDLSD